MTDLVFASFEATWTATTPMTLPEYAGSTLRGAFGHAFRKVACTMRAPNCEGCLMLRQCVYPSIFETKEADQSTETARPFVIEPPMNGHRAVAPSESFCAGLVLFGKTIDYLPYFLVSFRELGHRGLGTGRGKCELSEFAVVNPLTHARALIYAHSDGLVRDLDHRLTAAEAICSIADLPTDRLTILFRTFTRLKHQGHFTAHVHFPILITRLLDRVESLAGAASSAPWLNGRSARELINLAKDIRVEDHPAHWQDWTRYSARQKTELKMGGVVGRVTYAGDLAPFLPLLVLGQFTHVGKGAVFGMGKYELERPS